MNPQESNEAETDVREILAEWKYRAEDELAYVTARKTDGKAVKPEESLAWNAFLSKTQLENIPRVLDAASEGNIWFATFLALWVGLNAGKSQAESNTYNARRKIRLDVTERAVKGGRAPKPQVEDRQAKAMRVLLEQYSRYPTKPFSEICQRVAGKTNYTPRQVRRIATAWGLEF